MIFTVGNLAIIPARGGSKRIPRKNIKDFLGKPIIAYSIAAAINSGLFSEVMVSTDNEEIARVAQDYAATVPFMRGTQNANDHATTLDVIKEVLQQYEERSIYFDAVCCIYATAPLINPARLKEGLNKLTNCQYTSVFPVAAFSPPVWRGLEITENENIKMIWPENLNKRSQDLHKVYFDAGQWYWLNPKLISNALYSSNSGAVVLPGPEVQDIDTVEDWKIAEIKYSLLNKQYEQL